VANLARLLRSSLPKDDVGVGLHDLEYFVSMSAPAPAGVTLAGTAITTVPPPLTVTPAAPAVRLRTAKAPFALANAPAHTLTVGDAPTPSRSVSTPRPDSPIPVR